MGGGELGDEGGEASWDFEIATPCDRRVMVHNSNTVLLGSRSPVRSGHEKVVSAHFDLAGTDFHVILL